MIFASFLVKCEQISRRFRECLKLILFKNYIIYLFARLLMYLFLHLPPGSIPFANYIHTYYITVDQVLA